MIFQKGLLCEIFKNKAIQSSVRSRIIMSLILPINYIFYLKCRFEILIIVTKVNSLRYNLKFKFYTFQVLNV